MAVEFMVYAVEFMVYEESVGVDSAKEPTDASAKIGKKE